MHTLAKHALTIVVFERVGPDVLLDQVCQLVVVARLQSDSKQGCNILSKTWIIRAGTSL
jgi:hypothetical protein